VPPFPTAAVGTFALVSGTLALACHWMFEPRVALSATDWTLVAATAFGPLGAPIPHVTYAECRDGLLVVDDSPTALMMNTMVLGRQPDNIVSAKDGQEAVAEAFEMLDTAPGLEVILHCFSAPDWVEAAAERRWYCSFAGNLTYPANGDLRDAAKLVPEDRILAETDAPFLTPQSKRRERNQPANVVETATLLAELRGVTSEELDETVTANAERVFGW
jgi:CheY-like chemotaxis protein